MRFGKKLALLIHDDQTGAPYLSHKPMKEAINRTVRELRTYQARKQGSEAGWQDDAGTANAPSQQELTELEEGIAALDKELFVLVDNDLARILRHVRDGETQLQNFLAGIQGHLHKAGFLFEEADILRLEKALPFQPTDRTALCRQWVDLRLRSQTAASAKSLESVAQEYNALVDAVNLHAQYLEINVAGFRKLLKRHEKQIPKEFRSRPMPCLGFHCLVTHRSRMILALTQQLCEIIADLRRRHSEVASSKRTGFDGGWTDLHEVKGLGPECEMVLTIQRKLKDPTGQQFGVLGDLLVPSAEALYPKPATLARPQPQPLQKQLQALGEPMHVGGIVSHQPFESVLCDLGNVGKAKP